MIGKKHYYKADKISVSFEPKLCIHAAECVRGLPQVFDSKKRPWIEPGNDSPEEIMEVIKRCPSGALKFEGAEELKEPIQDYVPTVKTIKNGPLYFRGTIELSDSEGNQFPEQGRLAICRCGASKNKPFCDNTHKEIKFNAE